MSCEGPEEIDRGPVRYPTEPRYTREWASASKHGLTTDKNSPAPRKSLS
jgi:hypothetical protein